MRALLAPLLVGSVGCGLGLADDTSGGRTDLPRTGAGPWQKLPADDATPLEEPLVAVDQILEYTEPALLADGDGYLLFVTREPADAPVGDTAIWRAELPALDALTTAPALTQVLVADQALGGRTGRRPRAGRSGRSPGAVLRWRRRDRPRRVDRLAAGPGPRARRRS
jgi:hypothetical protein